MSAERPWDQPLFAASIPVEIVLRLGEAFCAFADPDGNPLDQAVLQWLAVEAFRHGADYREVPWPLRLLHVRLTGQPERQVPRRPKSPE